jgi:hypothetical protein
VKISKVWVCMEGSIQMILCLQSKSRPNPKMVDALIKWPLQFIEVLNKELTATAEAREKFIEDFSEVMCEFVFNCLLWHV